MFHLVSLSWLAELEGAESFEDLLAFGALGKKLARNVLNAKTPESPQLLLDELIGGDGKDLLLLPNKPPFLD